MCPPCRPASANGYLCSWRQYQASASTGQAGAMLSSRHSQPPEPFIMLRRLLMAAAAPLALLAHAAQAQSTATMVEAGAMTRQPLRYAFESGMSDVAVLEMNVQTLIKLGDQQV